jgi:uncharacterized protein YbjT (DUF2867 family)
MDRLGILLLAGRMTTSAVDNGRTLIVGGTGKTGRRVADRMQRAGLAFQIGSRSGAPPFDWADRDTWEPVLRGISSVYLAYSPDAGFPGAAETIGAFATLAVRARAGRVVLLTGRGEEAAQRSERLVQESGADWTVIRSSFFAQNFSEDFLSQGVLAGEVAFPAANVAEPFIDIEDIADIAVAALTQHGHCGRVYEVTGPRLLTFGDAVSEIAAAVGYDIRYQPVSSAEFLAAMTDEGVPDDFATNLAELFYDVLDGRNAHLNDGVEQALGRPPRDFSDFARRSAAEGIWNRTAARVS